MKIAHISDLHLIDLDSVPLSRLLNKRLTGWVNLKLHRGSKHRGSAARAVVQGLRSHAPDHVVVTGDLTNLALESEFELALGLLRDELGLSPDEVSVVPGNHDTYTRGAYRRQRFQRYLAPYLTSDLPDACNVPELGPFPYVRLRGPVAFIGLSTARPRPPLMASGALGAAQRHALRSVLAHREVRKRTPVILQHHPLHNPPTFAKAVFEGLWDASSEAELLRDVSRGLVLHGHLHRRGRRRLDTARGHVDAICTGSASLIHADPERMAGFNLYELSDEGSIETLSAFRMADPQGTNMVSTPIPFA